MRFDESREGDYRIFVGAMEAPGGDGYTAALIVERGQPQRQGRGLPRREPGLRLSLAQR